MKKLQKKVVRNFIARNPLLGKCCAHEVTNKQIRHRAKSDLRKILKSSQFVGF